MNTLQDILGLITKGKVKPPTDKDYFIVASYTDSQEMLKPQPKMQANLVSVGTLKKFIQIGGGVQSVVAGTNVTVDNTDPLNPIVSASGGGGTQTLDQVLNEGHTGIDKFILLNTSTNIGYCSLNYNQLVVADEDYAGQLTKQTLVFNSNLTTNSASYGVGLIGFTTSGSTSTGISFVNPTSLNSIVVPDKSGTLATLDDIPTPAYKVYTALISQSGTNDPTLVILENTLGQTVTAARSAPGRYALNVTGNILLITKTWWSITNDNNNGFLFYMNKDNAFGDTNTVYIDTKIIGGVYVDGILQSTPIEIKVYN